MKLVDSHCHIHDPEFYPDSAQQVYDRAVESEVYMLIVGTSELSSRQAIEFANAHDQASAIVGVHPHDVKNGWNGIKELTDSSNVVGIGEIGLDYYYDNSPRDLQRQALEEQLQLARDRDLPVSFHVREAQDVASGSVWDDFWPIVDNFLGIDGVLHSFTDTAEQLERGFVRNLYVGVNGIATFTKDNAQRQMYASIPLEKMLLETDAPFLTPHPLRGKVNESTFVWEVAKSVAAQKNVPLSVVCDLTTKNARTLYRF